MYFDNLKKNQQNQGGKNWCYIEYFMSLIISNFRTTASCFETIKLGISFNEIAKKMVIKHIKTFSNSAK